MKQGQTVHKQFQLFSFRNKTFWNDDENLEKYGLLTKSAKMTIFKDFLEIYRRQKNVMI